MSYNSAIPTPSQRLKDSQPEFLENFKCISALLGVDHVISPWESPASGNQGKHNQVTLPEQGSDPTTLTNEMAIYTKEVSGSTNLFLANENAGNIYNISAKSWASSQGSTILPSGLVLKWGQGTTNASGLQTVTFTSAFSSIYSIQVTIATASGSNSSAEANDRYARVYAYSATQFSVVTYVMNVSRKRAANDYTWFAIGV